MNAVRSDAERYTATELLRLYGRCPFCGKPRCAISEYDDKNNLIAMSLGCTACSYGKDQA